MTIETNFPEFTPANYTWTTDTGFQFKVPVLEFLPMKTALDGAPAIQAVSDSEIPADYVDPDPMVNPWYFFGPGWYPWLDKGELFY